MSCLPYTKAECLTNLKAIDLDLNVGLKRTELDTTTDQQEFELSQDTLQKQRDYFLNMYQQHCMQDGSAAGIVALEDVGGPLYGD